MNDRNGYRQIIVSRDDVLTFGKHKEQSVYWILEHEPEYILWLSDEKIAQFPEDILDDAEIYQREEDEWMDYADQEYWTDED